MRTFFRKSTLCFSMVAALAFVSIEVEPWALALSTILLFSRFGSERKWWPSIPSFWINAFSVVTLGLVLAQFKTFLGQEASSTLLVVLASLRIADFRSERDEKFLILLGFILVALKFLFTLDVYWFPIGGLVFLGLWRSLLPPDMESPWRVTIAAAIKALPIVLILFFVFPRVQVPWLRNLSPNMPLVGMSESIGPGDISDLTLSQETAFRAKFNNYKPVVRDLYWRGAVLEKMDGFKWNKTNELVREIPVTHDEINADYSITLEPSALRVLPTFEHTRFISSPMIPAVKTDRSTYRAADSISSRVQYSGTTSDTWNGPTVENPLQLTELPPKTKAWVKEIKSQKPSFEEKVKILKNFFSNGNFHYTRQPGSYKDLDELLFERRLGFCEHFAGAYATLARALDIPARVITGYQGGEWNAAGEFYRVTQADAHAWVEVKNPRGMWFRVDPTFWIEPLRIELGGLNYFQLAPGDLKQGIGYALQKLKEQNWIAQFISTVEYQVDNVNYLWTRALLNFDIAEQQKIFKVLAPKIGWWMAMIAFVIFMFFALRRLVAHRRSDQDEAVETFLWLQNQLRLLGYQREFNEAPLVFLEKIKEKRPGDEVLLNKTIQLYRYERYRERKSGPDDWDRLKRAWKRKFAQNQKNAS